MTITAATDVVLIISGNNVSANATKVEVPFTADALDTTTFGSTWHTRTGGLKDGQLTVTFLNDFAAAALDSIMYPLVGTTVSFIARATSAATSTSNPAYTGSIFIAQWTPLSAQVGQLNDVDVSFPTSGTISRLTS